ncbi:TRAP transporter small permease [Papillibacter cinnamivorans]|uniref:TRAP-type C4-dicarboxylate transport system, small permease component n=1 Tax=Papillibacter cinnamivorans DSM 12816 TaxID=1122930 RepID=A0A1W2A1F9_9FIRM|nr:TRAP transporter small permease [Papillibacter cinnamivorans]SMC54282.1 TRAP-type C4-dicarboxylate transport system, small permease component [Papillibacter cinnamivorans DSM 12816]
MKVIERVLDVVCLIAKIIAAAMLGVMLVVSLVEIGRRYILGLSFPWADELIRYCIVGVAMFGGAVAFRQAGGLVAFDLILGRLKGAARLVLELAVNTICLAFCSFMLRNAIATVNTPSIVKQISIGLQISMRWPYMSIVAGMALIVVFSIEKYYRIIKDYKTGKLNSEPGPIEEGGIPL